MKISTNDSKPEQMDEGEIPNHWAIPIFLVDPNSNPTIIRVFVFCIMWDLNFTSREI